MKKGKQSEKWTPMKTVSDLLGCDATISLLVVLLHHGTSRVIYITAGVTLLLCVPRELPPSLDGRTRPSSANKSTLS